MHNPSLHWCINYMLPQSGTEHVQPNMESYILFKDSTESHRLSHKQNITTGNSMFTSQKIIKWNLLIDSLWNQSVRKSIQCTSLWRKMLSLLLPLWGILTSFILWLWLLKCLPTDDMHELQIFLILIADCMKDFSLMLVNDNYWTVGLHIYTHQSKKQHPSFSPKHLKMKYDQEHNTMWILQTSLLN